MHAQATGIFRLQDIFSLLPAFLLDAQGRVIHWNSAAERATGIAASRLLGTRDHWRPFWRTPRPLLAHYLLSGEDVIPPATIDASFIRHSREMASGVMRVEREVSGTTMVWTFAALLHGSDGSVGVCQIFSGIHSHNFLVRSPLIKAFIDNFPVPVSLVIEHKIAGGNRAYAALLGHDSVEEIIGLPVSHFIDESDRGRFLRANANSHAGLKPGQVYCWKYRIRGEIRYLEGRPTVFAWAGEKALLSVVTDVTERVCHEQRMRGERARLEKENQRLLERISKQEAVFLGHGAAMRKAMSLALRMGKTGTNLVIVGETGTGKSLMARIIHEVSPRRDRPFVMVNCAAIPESLLESEFFGHVRGAFTGAEKDKQGFLGAAHGGTLFLDEVAELSPAMQAKLLHAVESKRYTPVGGHKPLDGDVRLICATNRDLVGMVRDGLLRADFFYRIFVVDIPIPPLRERREDLPQLIRFFFRKFQPLDMDADVPDDLMRLFLSYDWPGNVRELQNVILRYLATGEVQFISPQGEPRLPVAAPPAASPVETLDEALERAERDCILRALDACQGNKILAAQRLQVNLRTFHRRCARLGIVRRLAKPGSPAGASAGAGDAPDDSGHPGTLRPDVMGNADNACASGPWRTVRRTTKNA